MNKTKFLEIKQMYIQALIDDVAPNVFADQVLRLFGVGTRTFKVGDKVQWRGMNLIVVEIGVNEVLIATSQNVDDKGYNDWWVGTKYVC